MAKINRNDFIRSVLTLIGMTTLGSLKALADPLARQCKRMAVLFTSQR